MAQAETLLDFASMEADPDPLKCICRGGGKIVADDDRWKYCPYHSLVEQLGNIRCYSCGKRHNEAPVNRPDTGGTEPCNSDDHWNDFLDMMESTHGD